MINGQPFRTPRGDHDISNGSDPQSSTMLTSRGAPWGPAAAAAMAFSRATAWRTLVWAVDDSGRERVIDSTTAEGNMLNIADLLLSEGHCGAHGAGQ